MSEDIVSLDSKNYTTLFYAADRIISTLYEYYPPVRGSFDKELVEVRACFKLYGKKDNRFINSYLKHNLDITKLPTDDFANRQIIYKLSDAYFTSCIWYSIFNYITGYKGKEYSAIGKANDILADYLRNIIQKYSTGGNNVIDDRDIGKEICMAWLSYENRVANSLYYKGFEPKTYRKIVNVALTKKLGLSEIYTERGA